MKIPILFSFLLTAQFASSQSRNFDLIDEIYSNWKNSSNKCETFFYSDTMDAYTIERVKDLFLTEFSFIQASFNGDTTKADRIRFDSIERNYIIGQLINLNSVSWPDALFPKSKAVHFTKIDSIQKSVNDRKLDPLVRLCHSIYIFSHPIFLRQNSICLFYSGTTNFATKDGEFWIYRKEGSHWKKYAPIYRWTE